MSVIFHKMVDDRLTAPMRRVCERLSELLDSYEIDQSGSLMDRLCTIAFDDHLSGFLTHEDGDGAWLVWSDIMNAWHLAQHVQFYCDRTAFPNLEKLTSFMEGYSQFYRYFDSISTNGINAALLKAPVEGLPGHERMALAKNLLRYAAHHSAHDEHYDCVYPLMIDQMVSCLVEKYLMGCDYRAVDADMLASSSIAEIVDLGFMDQPDRYQREVFMALMKDLEHHNLEGLGVDDSEAQRIAILIHLGKEYLANIYAGNLLTGNVTTLVELGNLDQKARRFAKNMLGDTTVEDRGPAWRLVLETARRESLFFWPDLYKAAYPDTPGVDLPRFDFIDWKNPYEFMNYCCNAMKLTGQEVDLESLTECHSWSQLFVDRSAMKTTISNTINFLDAAVMAKLSEPGSLRFSLRDAVERCLQKKIDNPSATSDQFKLVSCLYKLVQGSSLATKHAVVLASLAKNIENAEVYSSKSFLRAYRNRFNENMLDKSPETARAIAPILNTMKDPASFISHFKIGHDFFRKADALLSSRVKRAILGVDFEL